MKPADIRWALQQAARNRQVRMIELIVTILLAEPDALGLTADKARDLATRIVLRIELDRL